MFDADENELSMIDFLQVFIDTLNKVFVDVNELDILYNPKKVYFALEELVMDGQVIQMSVTEAVNGLKACEDYDWR